MLSCFPILSYVDLLLIIYYRWDCTDVYKTLNKAHQDISVLEYEMEQLLEQASLFEVIVPEFKIIKGLRKELKMAKVRLSSVLTILYWNKIANYYL